MSISTFTLPSQNSTDAEFRNMVAGSRAALTAAGLVRTSDTGQIDPVTVLRPAASTAAGYEIWRFNDAAQATAPIFFKLEYGSGSPQARVQLWLTVGTGSNGAGTITDIRGTRQGITPTANSATIADCWAAAGDGYAVLCLFAGTNGTFFFIERARAADGSVDTTSQGAGFVVLSGTANWMATSQDGVWTESAAGGIIPSLNAATSPGLYRGTTYAFPVYPIIGFPRSPCRAGVIVFPADAGSALAFTVNLYGSAHIFRSMETGTASTGRGGTTRPALRYE